VNGMAGLSDLFFKSIAESTRMKGNRIYSVSAVAFFALFSTGRSQLSRPLRSQTAIDSGADSIEHGNAITDQQLKQMHDKGAFLDLRGLTGSRYLLVASIENTSGVLLLMRPIPEPSAPT
jgi:hypothetical protein